MSALSAGPPALRIRYILEKSMPLSSGSLCGVLIIPGMKICFLLLYIYHLEQ